MNLTFKGKAKRLDDIDLPKLGARLGVGEDEIHAFIDVETRGSGFDGQGRPALLRERHWFYLLLSGKERSEAVRQGLANPVAGDYPKESYTWLLKAVKINEEIALKSCSWGLGQVMGFNFKDAGYSSVHEMVQAFMDDEEEHLEASVNFILKNKLDDELRRHDWAGFAKGYNGAGYRKNRYDEKLADAYAKWKRIKDTPWKPNAMVDKPFPTDTNPPVEYQTPPELIDKLPRVAPVEHKGWLAALFAFIFRRKS